MLGQDGSSRLDTVLKMLLIAFVSLLAFSSGVYFGKEMSDSEYQLKTLEKDFNDNEKVADSAHDDHEAGTPAEDAMIDEEIAALSDKYMNSEASHDDVDGDEQAARDVASAEEHAKSEKEHGAKEHAAPKQNTKEHSAKKEHAQPKAQPAKDHHTQVSNETAPIRKSPADLTEVKKVAERVVNNESPKIEVKPKKENRKPASLPKVAGTLATAEYTVQVASYMSEKDAQSHAADLVKKGFPAYPLEATIKGKTWYRVSVGSFKTQKDATDYRSQLMKQANVASAIVQKIER